MKQLRFAIKHKLYALFTMDQFSFILKNKLYALFTTNTKNTKKHKELTENLRKQLTCH